MASRSAFRRYGRCGMELSELLPGLAEVADDITLIRSMHTGVNNHGSSLNAVPPLAHDARGLPEELLALAPSLNGQAPKRWRVESVPRLWLECRPVEPSATLPTTPTGVCGY